MTTQSDLATLDWALNMARTWNGGGEHDLLDRDRDWYVNEAARVMKRLMFQSVNEEQHGKH